MGRDAIIGWRFGSCLLLAIMMNSIFGITSDKLACNDATTFGRSKFQPIIDSPPSYATRNIKGKQIRMHRIISERILGRSLGYGEECDHIDGDGLNNKRSNLRIVDHRRNMRNTHNRRNATMSVRRHKQLTLWDYLIRMSRTQTSNPPV